MKIDPIIVLEETNEIRRAARLAAFMVVREDTQRQTDKVKQSMPKT